MKNTLLVISLLLCLQTVEAQHVTGKNREKLLSLASKLDSAYQADQQKIKKLLGNEGIARVSKRGIPSGVSPTGKILYTIDHNSGAARATKTTDLYPGGKLAASLTGKGMIVGIWENGSPDPNHQEFEGRLVIKDAANEIRDHASHVSGTIIAGGINPESRGMAYEATGHAYSGAGYLGEIAIAAADGLLVSSHSYGRAAGWSDGEWIGDPSISDTEDWKFGIYNDEAASLDEIAYLAPYYLLFRSAGNERGESGTGTFPPDGPYDTMTGEAIAKNIMAIGNVDPLTAVPQDGADVELSSSSSWGPSDDGRIKPDLVAPGTSLFSTSIDAPNAYSNKSGTSMSTPVTAGNAILLQQLFNRLNGHFMRSATLKGVLLHTTLDVGAARGPDYSHGHGFLDANLASRTVMEKGLQSVIEETTLENEATFQYDFDVTDPTSPLVVSISWTDPPGMAISDAVLDPTTIKLVNDLDVRISDPEGSSFQPWILNPAVPDAAATTGDNIRDNYEKIEIENPAIITYTITVTHKGALANPQDFTLIATNLPREDTRKTFYWIGNSGDWDDPTQWSNSSGGSTTNAVPGQNDRVVFDNNGFTGSRTVNLNVDVEIHQLEWLVDNGSSIDFDGNAITVTGPLNINGALASSEGLIRSEPLTTGGSIYINALNNSLNITLDKDGNDFILSGENGSLGKLALMSGNLVAQSDFDAEEIFLASGGSKQINFDGLDIATSALHLGDLASNNVSLIETKITFDGSSGLHQLSSEGGFFLPQVNVLSGVLSILNSGEIEDLNLSPGSALALASQAELSLSDWSIESSSDEHVGIRSISGTATIKSDSESKFCFDFVDIENINVAGSTKFVSEGNSTLTNGDGWIEAQCEDVLFADFDFRSPCAESTTFFEDLSDGNAVSWLWDFGDGSTSEDQSPIHEYDETGVYSVSLTINDGSEASTFKVVIEIVASTIDNPVITTQGGRLLTNSEGQAFQWYFEGEVIPGETSRLLSQTPKKGLYQVESSNDNCAALSDPFVVLGVGQDQAKFQIYPNPIQEMFYLKTEGHLEVIIQIVGLDGAVKRLFSNRMIGTNVTAFEATNLEAGIYIIRLLNTAGRVVGDQTVYIK